MGDRFTRMSADGWAVQVFPEAEGMLYPVLHSTCNKVHDAGGKVEVVARYADCTIWKCPSCGGQCDDRPISWGGNVERIGR